MKLGLPRVELLSQSVALLWMPLAEIGSFSRIFAEIIELDVPIVIKLDQLPIAIPHRGPRLPRRTVIVGIVPIE